MGKNPLLQAVVCTYNRSFHTWSTVNCNPNNLKQPWPPVSHNGNKFCPLDSLLLFWGWEGWEGFKMQNQLRIQFRSEYYEITLMRQWLPYHGCPGGENLVHSTSKPFQRGCHLAEWLIWILRWGVPPRASCSSFLFLSGHLGSCWGYIQWQIHNN